MTQHLETTGRAALTEALATQPFHSSPWRYLYLPDALPVPVARNLARTFPADRLTPSSRANSDKDYSLWSADLTTGHSTVDAVWSDLFALLASSGYRSLLSERSGVDLTGCRVSLTVWEYRGGDFLAPHLDKEEKVLTQIIYLNEQWAEGDGGRLLIQRSRDPLDVTAKLPPVLGAAAVLVRSDRSWHAVERSAPSAAPRRSLNLTYWSA